MKFCWNSHEPERNNVSNPLEHMFHEDLKLYCLPHSDTDDNGLFRVYVHGNSGNEELTWALLSNLSEQHTWSKEKLFAQAYRKIVMYLAGRGEYTFVIDKNEDGHPAIMESRFRHYRRRYGPICVETSPKPNTKWELRQVVRCLTSTKGTWTLRFPKSIQSPWAYSTMTKKLQSRSLGFGESIITLVSSGAVTVSDYTALSDADLLQTCEDWRWDGRLGMQDRLNDFYKVYLNLSWRRNMAVLREHIVKELNLLLKEMGYGTRIGVYGLITPEQYTDAINSIFDRENGLEEGYDAILTRGKYANYGRQSF